MRINLKFDVALAHIVNVIVYAEYDNVIQIYATYCSITHTKINTEQIMQLCRSDQVLSSKFGGVFSRDNLPDFAENAKFYVCNTDPSSEPGDHWVVLHAAEGREYINSLGGAISQDEFAQFLGGE